MRETDRSSSLLPWQFSVQPPQLDNMPPPPPPPPPQDYLRDDYRVQCSFDDENYRVVFAVGCAVICLFAVVTPLAYFLMLRSSWKATRMTRLGRARRPRKGHSAENGALEAALWSQWCAHILSVYQEGGVLACRLLAVRNVVVDEMATPTRFSSSLAFLYLDFKPALSVGAALDPAPAHRPLTRVFAAHRFWWEFADFSK